MKKTIEMMVQLLDNNNIPLSYGVSKKDGGLNSGNKERCHAMVTGYSRYSSFIIDSSASRNIDSREESFSSLYPYIGPFILMGDGLEILAKGIGRINLNNGYFNNVVYVPDLATNLLYVYQMTHTGSTKRVIFTQDDVEIS